jgi:hypothetical protein
MTPEEIYQANLGISHEAALNAVFEAGVAYSNPTPQTDCSQVQAELDALRAAIMHDVEGRN